MKKDEIKEQYGEEEAGEGDYICLGEEAVEKLKAAAKRLRK